MRYQESAEQQYIFKWANFMQPKYPELRLLHSIPNGGYRDKITAGILKAEGVKAGVPDIHLPIPRGGYASLYIELKAMDSKHKKGSLSQQEFLQLAQQHGNYAVICVGWNEATETIEKYINGEIVKDA